MHCPQKRPPSSLNTPKKTPQETASNNVRASFSAEVHVKGPYLYEMILQDPPHYLACDLILEIEENNQGYEERTVICHFPTLSNEELSDFVEGDEALRDMIMVQFQMKILEQLLLFCASHYASTLVIFADDAQADDLGVYHDFLTYEDQTLTSKDEKTEMVIPADRETFYAWIDFMDDINRKFQQSLWRDQRSNPTIRQYLKSQCVRASAHESQGTHNVR